MRPPGPTARLPAAPVRRPAVVRGEGQAEPASPGAESDPDMGQLGPEAIGSTPVTRSVYVGDVDAVFERVVAAGATLLRAAGDQFPGDRSG